MYRPNWSHEKKCSGIVAGLDEVGRGPWAGPVVAAAVILDRKRAPSGMNDSKQLKREEREMLYIKITKHSTYAVGIATVEEIDTLNILVASKLAMQRAFQSLGVVPTHALVDGNQPPELPCETQSIIGGDGISFSIAAASIVAKVTRDRMMCELASRYPGYGWETNAGYGTRCHQDGLKRHGLTPEHRKSFSPIRALMEAVA